MYCLLLIHPTYVNEHFTTHDFFYNVRFTHKIPLVIIFTDKTSAQ